MTIENVCFADESKSRSAWAESGLDALQRKRDIMLHGVHVKKTRAHVIIAHLHKVTFNMCESLTLLNVDHALHAFTLEL